jgi:hypothetical protein
LANAPAQDALLALRATGLSGWDAMLALVGGGASMTDFPVLKDVPATVFRPFSGTTEALGAFDALSCNTNPLGASDPRSYYPDPTGANAALQAFLDGNPGLWDLDLFGLSWVRSLPDGLSVGGDLYLSGTQVRQLPQRLTVGGDLQLGDAPLSALPDDLQVGGNLDADGSGLVSLPAGALLGQDVFLRRTAPILLPQGWRVNSNLRLEFSATTILPDRLAVQGYLDLRNTPIRTLPPGLEAGFLDLRVCRAWDGRIPPDAKVAHVYTDACTEGHLTLDAWRQRHPDGEPR